MIPPVPCHIKELNISCFGCCGNNFSSKEKIEEDIKLNTQELKEIGGKRLNKDSLKIFRDRMDGENALSLTGLCYNFVDLGGCSGCPLHNRVNELRGTRFQIKNNEDLRIGHCDINEECSLFIEWKKMSSEEKKKFIKWVKTNNYDSYLYSVENGEEKLLQRYYNSIQ